MPRGAVLTDSHPSPGEGRDGESYRAGFAAWRALALITFSGYDRASQFLGRSIRRRVPAGALGGGVRVRGRSRIGRAGVSVGLLVALRVVGEGRGKRAGAEHQRGVAASATKVCLSMSVLLRTGGFEGLPRTLARGLFFRSQPM